MKIYIAGSSQEIERCKQARAWLVAAGHEVVSTWTEVVAAVGDANPRTASDEQRNAWSVEDLEQVSRCDLLWFLAPQYPAVTRGAWGELCYAHARGKRLVCSGDTKQSIFCALGWEFATDHEAFAAIQEVRE